MFRVQFYGPPSLCAMAWAALASASDGGQQCGFTDLEYHAGVCWEVPVCCEHPWLVGIVGVQEGQGEYPFDLGYCPWVYVGSVVPEGVLGRVPVRTGGASRGLRGLRCDGVVQRDVVEAVDFRSLACPPVRQCGVVLAQSRV